MEIEAEGADLFETKVVDVTDVQTDDGVVNIIDNETDPEAESLSSGGSSTESEPGAMGQKIPFHRFTSMNQTNIKADDTMRGAARKILMFHFGSMLEHEGGTKVGKDIEELHDMRVAAMRMRSVIEVLESYLDMKMVTPYYKDIKSIRRILGTVRDLDVFLEKIDRYVVEQAPEMLHKMDPLTDSILVERAKNRGKMLMYLDDKRYNKFKKRFADHLEDKGSWKLKSFKKSGEHVPSRVKDVLPVLLYTQLATVRAYDDTISDEDTVDPSLEMYHELRIDVKILRYTLEFFREVLGPQAKDVIKDLKALQDNLGDMHDTVVALELLGNFERSGIWGKIDKNKNRLSNELQEYPGVDAYIQYREQELENLLEAFPDAWSRVMDPDFGVRFSQSISGIYMF